MPRELSAHKVNGCNGMAPSHPKLAPARLKSRTAERLARGVEGTHEV